MRPILPACLLLQACTVTVSQHVAWNVHSAAGLVDHSGTEVFAIDCPATAPALQLQLRARSGGGALHLRLCDPAGRPVFDDILRGGERDSTLQWPARAGTWRCELRFEAFCGSYRCELNARDEPLRIDAVLAPATAAYR